MGSASRATAEDMYSGVVFPGAISEPAIEGNDVAALLCNDSVSWYRSVFRNSMGSFSGSAVGVGSGLGGEVG